MSIAEFELRVCNKELKNDRLKLARAPLRYQPAPNPSQGPPPLDSFYCAMHLGDGSVKVGGIYGSDEQVEDWIGEYATLVSTQKIRLSGCRIEEKAERQGKESPSILTVLNLRKSGVFAFRISPVDSTERKPWYPVQDGLRRLGHL
jgi:hypothetical protein